MELKPMFPPLYQGRTEQFPERELPGRGLKTGNPHIQHSENLVPEDSFEHLAPTAETTPAPTTTENSGRGEGLKISYSFDLFYQLSQKVSAKMGQKGTERFFELSETVAEKFQGSFSLSIDPVGSFLNGTDKSLDLDPEVTEEFFDAVEGLAELTPEALENFLRETDDLFNALEGTYGEAGGAFDEIKAQIQSQAQKFFDQVGDVRDGGKNVAAIPLTEAVDELPPPEADLPESREVSEPLVGKRIPHEPYQEFLKEFLEFAKRFRQSVMLDVTTFQKSSLRMYASGNTDLTGKDDFANGFSTKA